MKTVKILFNNIAHEYMEGATLLEISKDFKEQFKFEIIVGQINGDMCELNQRVTKDCEIKFYDLMHQLGNKVYERGLIFMFISAVKELLKCDVKIAHSIDKGIYCEILNESGIKQDDISKLKEKMAEYVSNKIPFISGSSPRISAMEYYESISRFDKAESFKYVARSSILLYKFGDMYDYFYGDMPLDASYLKYFDISYIDSKSVVLLLPNIYLNGEIKPYQHYEGIFNAFKDFTSWADNQNIKSVADLNKVIVSNEINDLIYMNESYQNKSLFDIASHIKEQADIKIILIAGPSASGKTTTSKKLTAYLKSLGLKPHPISVDDYFLDREQTPVDEFGKYDFESIKAIDTNLFNDHLKKLLNSEEVLIPTYDFILGKKEYSNKLILENNGILIIEGLHALDETLTSEVDEKNKYKIYISPLTTLNIDNHNRITTSDIRLLRRMLRDNLTRGYNASKTLDTWRSVRRGEEKYIFPFQGKNDIVLNSSLLYEIGVLRTYVEPLLFSVEHDDPNYNEAIRLINLIRNVLPITGVKIPYDSILREFIGNSYFSKGDE